MNREITFRVYSTVTGAFDFVTLKELALCDNFRIDSEMFDANLSFDQFTGLQDANGVGIYEGDVVSGFGGELLGVIGWSGEDCMYLVKTKSGGAQLIPHYAENFKVIGNTHQNPEILT